MKATKYLSVFVLVVSFVGALGDLASARREGVKRVNLLTDDVKKIADDTSIEVGKREENIKIISKHTKEFGDGIYDKVNFEVKKTAASAYMMAKLLGSKNEVFRCIETREREALEDASKFYSQRFLTPGQDYESKAAAHQNNLIKRWKDDYYSASSQYGDIYRKTINEIQKANSESNIATLVRRYEETSKQMVDIIVSIHPSMAKVHIEVLRTFDELVRNIQKYAIYRIDETTKAIQSCFPRLYQTPALLPGDLF